MYILLHASACWGPGSTHRDRAGLIGQGRELMRRSPSPDSCPSPSSGWSTGPCRGQFQAASGCVSSCRLWAPPISWSRCQPSSGRPPLDAHPPAQVASSWDLGENSCLCLCQQRESLCTPLQFARPFPLQFARPFPLRFTRLFSACVSSPEASSFWWRRVPRPLKSTGEVQAPRW